MKIGFNEGSLLRRTLLHVGTFVVGSVAFIGFMSFVLVSIAGKVAGTKDGSAGVDDESEAPIAAGTASPGGPVGLAAPKLNKPLAGARPGRGKRGGLGAVPSKPADKAPEKSDD